ncbi:unnamed protein product [Microthlaspi erraticum]|uniref:Uncharacterized protein n=1 Tax=Microthlaspi erraticum TaxID=1685480 RepID=A0A6D2KNJ9_9BRAS|nr:unnamed protein product [Microthlaspi erraticum]
MTTYSGSGRGPGSFLSSLNNLINGLATGTSSSDKTKSLADELEEDQMVVVLRVILRTDADKAKALLTLAQISGVSSVTFDGDERVTMIGKRTMVLFPVIMQLRKHWSADIISVEPRKKAGPKKESVNDQLKKEDQKVVLEGERSGGEAFLGEKHPQSTKGSGESGLGINNSIAAGKSTDTAAYMRSRNDNWYSFCEFLNNRLRPLNISGCRAKDAIEFLRLEMTTLGNSTALVGGLIAACEAYGIKPKDNPFRSLAVVSYMKETREMTRETESIFFFSCNDNLDVEETSFNKAILKELYEREVTPLTYNLSGREDLDSEMLYRSSVGIMVVSNSCFARGSQYLDNLLAIMEHWKAKNLVIVPVFFKVTLSDVCGLEGHSEEVLLQYSSSIQADRIPKWKAALTEMASIDGYQWSKGTQFMLVKKVVRNICLRLQLKNSKNLVRILALLNHPQPSEAEIEGIWGMAGVGKTSIATEVFEILAPQYDLCYFLQDFHLMCQRKGLRQMRDDFFSKVFGEEKLSIGACDTKQSFMRDWFHNKAILVVLDDVSSARDAEYVVGGFGWFSRGHRIILTSRRKQVLVQCKVKEPYEIHKLCDNESFRLCKQYLKEENAIISELMSCSSGIPLALKVLVSSVSKQHINDMKEHLQSLRRNPPTKIQEAFQRSFDGLDENEKNIFLDLACFFRGENKDHVVQLLDACGFPTYLGICELIDESLISLLDNKIEIPIPFQDMGRFIVHEEDEDPCERSRLWDSNDIANVLENTSGTEAIEGIFMDASDLTCQMSPNVFSEMHRLRLLKLYCSTSWNECKLHLPQGLDTLPDELRLLHWEYYPLKYLPQKFNPENLVEVNMPYSNMEKIWQRQKNLGKLKNIKLSHSRNLNDVMMLSEAMNLEYIDLEGCTSLVDVSKSIPLSGKLVSLNMKDCSHLRTLPAMLGLTCLRLLNLSGCSELEEIQDFAPNLKQLYLAGTDITELPLSIENLTELVTLDLENCRRLQHLPFGIKNSRSIVELKLSGCSSLESLSKLEALV